MVLVVVAEDFGVGVKPVNSYLIEESKIIPATEQNKNS